MRVVAVTNQKGGTGKTTTAVNLAAALGELGHRVLLVDLDPQGSASRWLGVSREEKGRELAEALAGERAGIADAVRPTGAPGVDLLPGGKALASAEKVLARETVGGEVVLRRLLAGLAPRPWRWCFIDCPPALGLLTVNALAAADELLVPVEAHGMAVDGLALLLETVEKARGLNPRLAVGGLLVCRMRAGTRLAGEVVEHLRAHHGGILYRAAIRESTRLAEAPTHAQPVTLYDPKGRGAEDYRAAAAEFLQREEG